MKNRLFLLILISPFIFLSYNSLCQCDINTGCAGTPTLTVDPPTFDAATLSIVLDNIEFGEIECTAANYLAGVAVYIYQLLPNGNRMELCNVLNDAPFNVVGSVGLSFGLTSFCNGSTVNIGTVNVGPDQGFIPCDGAFLELEAVLFITDNLGFDPTVSSVYSELNANEFISVDLGALNININNEFPGNGAPLTTASITDLNGGDGPITVNCGEDVQLDVEGLSRLANCPDYDDISTGIASELSNEFFYTVNGGAPVIVQSAATGAAGGQLTGPDPALAGNCYAGILGLYTLEWASLPADLCDGSVVVVTITTTDIFTGQTLTDEFTINYTGGTCGTPCNNPGCTDPCDPNFDMDATIDDPTLCAGYDDTCNADCTAGPFGGTFDPLTCACINETAPINGCTDATACNFNPTANCDDGNCQPAPVCNTDPCIGDIETIDPANACNCIIDEPQVIGCITAAACNFNPNANCEDSNLCVFATGCDVCDGNGGVTDNPEAGDACDDGNANTVNDIIQPDCTCAGEIPGVTGCTDSTACNYNPAATIDDNSCLPVPNCNIDICAGDTEIVDPNDPCVCIIDVVQVLGCTNPAACNFDTNANCDDNSCDIGNTNCPDPCNAPNPDDGCDLTTDTFDAATCTVTNTPNCAAGETFNPAACECITAEVPGCTDPCDPAFDPAATNDDLCVGYSTDCNADCTAGPFGGNYDQASCSCINETIPVVGCTDAMADNYNPAANCDDGSCIVVCEEEITGAILADEGCDVGGITISIIFPDATIINVVTDATGNFVVPGGPFPCGTYTAAFFDLDEVPVCYEETGSTEPISFNLDGNENGNNDVAFVANPNIPTLSQWGLIILALLLMCVGSVSLFQKRKKVSFI